MTLSYQWKKNGVNITDATSSTLVLSDLAASDSGSYTVAVTESESGATINAVAKSITIATLVAAFASHTESSVGGLGSLIATTLQG